MKTIRYIGYVFLSSILLFASGCEERLLENPYDRNCPKELFTPSNLTIETIGFNIKLSWYQENKRISGFIIKRSEDGGSMREMATLDVVDSTWYDRNPTGGISYDYELYAYADENMSNPVEVSYTPLFSPIVNTIFATDITHNSAVLGGEILNDGGTTITEKGICYSREQNPYLTDEKIDAGGGSAAFTLQLKNLDPDTYYYGRAYAINATDTAIGTQVAFRTKTYLPPTVTTKSAVRTSVSEAILFGTAKANNYRTNVYFEYGLTTAYGQEIGASPLSVEGFYTYNIDANISDLLPGETYHFRIKAINEVGTSYGEDRSFTTYVLPAKLPYDGLVVYYPFEGNTEDRGGYNYHGTLREGATASGVLSMGDNNKDRLNMPYETLEGLNDFTVAADLKINVLHIGTNNTGNTFLSGARSSAANALTIFYEPIKNSWRIVINDNSDHYLPADSTVEDLDWHHLAVTRKGSEARLYIDGNKVGDFVSLSTSVLDVDAGGVLLGQDQDAVGGSFDANQCWAGEIDDFIIYSRAMEDDEILQLYNK